MIQGVPWQTITAASGGWVFFGMCMFGLITGRWLVTRRESDAVANQILDRLKEAIKRAEKAEENNDRLVGVTADMLAMGHLTKASLEAAIAARWKQQQADAEAAGEG